MKPRIPHCVAALAALISMPGLFAATKPILVHGHRGARAVMPENTLAAFEYAIEAGADVLELDMAVTADNVVVVSHDSSLPESICRWDGPGAAPARVIRRLSFAQVRHFDCGSLSNRDFPRQKRVAGARVPSLDEVLALGVRGGFEFNIETKINPRAPQMAPPPEDFARLVLEVVRKHGLESRVILQSFDFRTLHAMKKLAPGLRLAALYSGKPEDFTAIAARAGATIISPQYRLVTRERVEAAHGAGLQVIPWTANTVEDWDKLVEAGVDAIITDDPAGLLAYLKAKALR